MANNKGPINNELNFMCNDCNKQFKTYTNYRLHIKIHTNPIQCKYCDKKFSHESSNYKIHLATHTKDLNYSCEICNKKFISKTILTRHILTNHPESIDRSDYNVYSSLPKNYKQSSTVNSMEVLLQAVQHVENQ